MANLLMKTKYLLHILTSTCSIMKLCCDPCYKRNKTHIAVQNWSKRPRGHIAHLANQGYYGTESRKKPTINARVLDHQLVSVLRLKVTPITIIHFKNQSLHVRFWFRLLYNYVNNFIKFKCSFVIIIDVFVIKYSVYKRKWTRNNTFLKM